MFSTVIVIPSYNELPTLKSLVKKLNKNNILIIDDASTDGTSKFLKEKKIIHISNKENIGYEGSLIKAFKYLMLTTNAHRCLGFATMKRT